MHEREDDQHIDIGHAIPQNSARRRPDDQDNATTPGSALEPSSKREQGVGIANQVVRVVFSLGGGTLVAYALGYFHFDGYLRGYHYSMRAMPQSYSDVMLETYFLFANLVGEVLVRHDGILPWLVIAGIAITAVLAISAALVNIFIRSTEENEGVKWPSHGLCSFPKNIMKWGRLSWLPKLWKSQPMVAIAGILRFVVLRPYSAFVRLLTIDSHRSKRLRRRTWFGLYLAAVGPYIGYFALFVIPALVFVAPALWARQYGEHLAKTEIERFQPCEKRTQAPWCAPFKRGEFTVTGVAIAGTEAQILIFDGQKAWLLNRTDDLVGEVTLKK